MKEGINNNNSNNEREKKAPRKSVQFARLKICINSIQTFRSGDGNNEKKCMTEDDDRDGSGGGGGGGGSVVKQLASYA